MKHVTKEDLSSPIYSSNLFHKIFDENINIQEGLQKALKELTTAHTPSLYTNVIEPLFVRHLPTERFSITATQAKFMIKLIGE